MATFSTLVKDLSLPEAPRWHDGKLWFSDIHEGRVLTANESEAVAVVVKVPNQPSGLGWLPSGELLIVSMLDRQLLCWDGDQLRVYADLSGLASYLCNDMVVDAVGRAYVGGAGPELRDGSRHGAIILVNPDRRAEIVAEHVEGPNGAVVTPDGRTLIFAETVGRRLTAWDVADDGALVNRRMWADLGEIRPDGICLDASGAIWVAGMRSGEFLRVVEGGEVIERLSVGNRTAFACMLGGADRRTLYVSVGTAYDDSAEGARQGAIEYARVEVAGAGWP